MTVHPFPTQDLRRASPHILVVDDDAGVRAALTGYLRENGLRASMASSGSELTRAIRNVEVDLIVMEARLPGENGVDICRRIRQSRDIPTIILTAAGAEIERIVGLENGADDYVTKPFSSRELLARIRAVLRRANSLPRQYSELPAGSIKFDDWLLDVDRQTVTKLPDGDGAALSSVEFRLLMAFLSSPRIVLSRERLVEKVNGRNSVVSDRSVDNQVSRLRKKFEPDPRRPKIIKTVWGGGYMLVADVVRT